MGIGGRGTRLKVARTVLRVLQHDGDFAAAFLSFRILLQTMAGKEILRTADAREKNLDQLSSDAAERRRHAQGGGDSLVDANGCHVKPFPAPVFIVAARCMVQTEEVLARDRRLGPCAQVTLTSMHLWRHCVGRKNLVLHISHSFTPSERRFSA